MTDIAELRALRTDAAELLREHERLCSEAADLAAFDDAEMLRTCRSDREATRALVGQVDAIVKAEQGRQPTAHDLWEDFQVTYVGTRRRDLSPERQRLLIGKYGPRVFKLLKW